MQNNIIRGTLSLLRRGLQNHWHKVGNKHYFVRHISTTWFLKYDIDQSFTSTTLTNVEKKLKKKDNIPDEYNLIYKHDQIFEYSTMIFSTNLTLIGTLGAVIYFYNTGIPDEIEISEYTFYDCEGIFITIFSVIFVSVFLIKRYIPQIVLRLYHNKSNNEYKIITPSNIPTVVKCTSFKHNNKPLLKPRSLLNKYNLLAVVVVNNKSFILHEDHFFRTVDFYNFVDGENHIYR